MTETSKHLPLKLVRNPNSPFPDYIDFSLNQPLCKQLNSYLDGYKSQTHPASIYSFIEKKTVQSARRNSEKKSFRDEHIESLLSYHLIPLMKSLLETTNPENDYHITIGTQHFDYIKYQSGGYFEKHRDFTRINSLLHQQYTVLIGLSSPPGKYYWRAGHTILWFPVDSTNITDYENLMNPDTDSKVLYSKYRIPNTFSKEDLLRVMEDNTTVVKYLPMFFNTLEIGNVLAFKSSLVHSGEKHRDTDTAKELLSITINITYSSKPEQLAGDGANVRGIITSIPPTLTNLQPIVFFDKCESWMVEFVRENLTSLQIIPFQIILCSGEYNNKKFANRHLMFWNFDKSISNPVHKNMTEGIGLAFNEIYEQTKSELHTRGREIFICSTVESKESKISSLLENVDGISFLSTTSTESGSTSVPLLLGNSNAGDQLAISKKLENVEQTIFNYWLNFNFEHNQTSQYHEEVTNTWEESGCNDSGDEYDESTYFSCTIDVKFGFALNVDMIS